MNCRGPARGDVVSVAFPNSHPPGHEQEGERPGLILAIPARGRFPFLFLAPFTRDKAQSWLASAPGLYLRFPRGAGGLPLDSVLMLDQVRSVDAARVRRFLGRSEPALFDPVLERLIKLLRKV